MAAVEGTCGRDGLPTPTAAHITATLPLMLDMELQDLMFALLALGLSFPQPPLCHHSSLSEWGVLTLCHGILEVYSFCIF